MAVYAFDKFVVWSQNHAKILFGLYLLFIILFASSFRTLGPLEMGIARNNIASSVDKSKVYMGGRYFLGIGKEFVIYPTTAQNLEMSNVMAATSDKQFVYLDLAIQYKLNATSLIDLFTERQQTYDSFYRREAEQALKEVCVQWQTIPDFYVKRTEISAQMEQSIRTILSDNHAELVAFQLRGIKLQDATESKIIETLVAEQEEITEGIIQTTTVVKAQKEQFKTAADAEIKIINSEANALGIEISSKAEAKAFQLITDAQSSKLTKLEETLSLVNPQRLLTYLWYTGLAGAVSQKSSIKIGTDSISQAKLT
mmetsp:Transcript_22825/g.47343  ORF Transcript_22825/g.47343 Transcript_22825/m.47343 type:complete len:312 (+) Transcript_22825:29-964(+)